MVEVIDTAGQGALLLYDFSILANNLLLNRRVCYSSGSMGPVRISSFGLGHVCSFLPSEGQGFILVYSIASRSTFDRLEIFRQSMLRVKRQNPIFMLVGNKCDKIHEREVSKDEGAALARSFGCFFIETSAKTAHNVELVFTNLIRALRSKQQEFEAVPRLLEGTRKREKCYIL
jgi:GTPase SAR1 family protein